MKRFIIFFAAFVAAPAMAQTTLDITVPGTGNPVCSYITGAVTNEATPGHLQATATSSSGAGCGTGSGNVTFGPASPLSPQSTTLPTSTGNVNFSFQALNATSCSGVITGAAAGSFTGGNPLCSGAACSSLVSAVASFNNPSTTSAATDTVTLTCLGTSGQATSIATVTVPKVGGGGGGGGSCATVVKGDGTAGVNSFTQQGVANIRVGGDQHTISADMTSYQAVFGNFPSTGTIAYDILPISNYISMKVQPPPGFFANAPAGWWSKIGPGTSDDDTKVSVTISTTCGDFSNPSTDAGSSVVPGCYEVGAGTEGGVAYSAVTVPLISQCLLHDGTTYYFNLINANITNVLSNGNGSAKSYRDGPGSQCKGKTSCSIPIENGPVSDYPGF